MSLISDLFAPFPVSARNGVLLLFAGWICFLAALKFYYLPDEEITRMVVVAAALCYVVAKGFNWGRILCLFANVMICIWCVQFAVGYFYPQYVRLYGNTLTLAASLLNLTLFAASTYFLLKKESRSFFKTFRRKSGDRPV